MPTEVVKTIGSQPDDDYSTLAAWYADRKGNLVQRDTIEVAELRGEDHDVGDGFTMGSSGVTVDADHYFVIRAMAGAEFKGNAGNLNGVARVKLEWVEYHGAYLAVIGCYVPYTRFERFVVWGDAVNNYSGEDLTSLSLACLNVGYGVDACVANGLGVRAHVSIPHAYWSHAFVEGVRNAALVKNCVVYDIGISTMNFSEASCIYECTYCYNNTVANVYGAFDKYGIRFCNTVKNNLVFNIPGYYAHTIIDCTTVDYNATDDGQGLGEHGIQIVGSNEVENTTPDNFHAKLKSTAQCRDAGTDLSGTVDTDVYGTSRPQGNAFDIGAWEYEEQQPGVKKIPWHLFFAGM